MKKTPAWAGSSWISTTHRVLGNAALVVYRVQRSEGGNYTCWVGGGGIAKGDHGAGNAADSALQRTLRRRPPRA